MRHKYSYSKLHEMNSYHVICRGQSAVWHCKQHESSSVNDIILNVKGRKQVCPLIDLSIFVEVCQMNAVCMCTHLIATLQSCDLCGMNSLV